MSDNITVLQAQTQRISRIYEDTVEELERLQNDYIALQEEYLDYQAKTRQRAESLLQTIADARRDTETKPVYSESDLDLLARLIMAEAGGMGDTCQLLVGNVVLNRMVDERFPDTIYDVIYARGQYQPTWTGAINNTPSEQVITNARLLLEGLRICPANVVWQSSIMQGDGLYMRVIENGGTIVFCY